MNHLVQKLATISDDLDAVRDAVRRSQEAAKVEFPWVQKLEAVQSRLDFILATCDGEEIGRDFPP